MTRQNDFRLRTLRRQVSTLLFAGLGLAAATPALAQAPPPLNEHCIVSVLNRNVRVKPDGTWVLPNIPANFGFVRARATCTVNGETISGESAPFLIAANGSIDVPPIVLGPTTPIPQSITVVSPAPQLGQIGQTVQLSVTARFADGTQRDVAGAATGTRYVISNPAIATVTADGLVSALASGTVLIQATHEGTSGFTSVRVVLSADSDGDGIPDDLELSLGLNPNNPADAFEDLDRDGLSNRDEALGGTNLRDADSDDDGLSDGEEVRPGTDGFVTNPLSVDTDGDGVRDGLEVASGSNPTDATSVEPRAGAADADGGAGVVHDHRQQRARRRIAAAGGDRPAPRRHDDRPDVDDARHQLRVERPQRLQLRLAGRPRLRRRPTARARSR